VAEETISFRSNNSVLSKINGSSNPSLSQEQMNSGESSTANVNAQQASNDQKQSTQGDSSISKVNNSPNPADGSQGVSVDSMKRDASKKPEAPNPGVIREQQIETTNNEDTGEVTSNKVEKGEVKESSWLKRKIKEALAEQAQETLKGLMGVDDPKSAEKDPASQNKTNTQKSKVGKVPVLDNTRPEPSSPSFNQERTVPSTKMPAKTPANSMPKMNMPNFSMPKLKLR